MGLSLQVLLQTLSLETFILWAIPLGQLLQMLRLLFIKLPQPI